MILSYLAGSAAIIGLGVVLLIVQVGIFIAVGILAVVIAAVLFLVTVAITGARGIFSERKYGEHF